MTDDEFEAISRRCAAAIPSPWRSTAEGRDHQSGAHLIVIGDGTEHGDRLAIGVGLDHVQWLQLRDQSPFPDSGTSAAHVRAAGR